MKRIYTLLAVAALYASACSEALVFPELATPPIPEATDAEAKLLWIGPAYKVALHTALEDPEGITTVRITNKVWQLDTSITLNQPHSYELIDTFLVPKDVNPTKHVIELTTTNSKGGIAIIKIDVLDLTAENQIPGYDPDELPPIIDVTKPTLTKFLGFGNEPISIDVEATVSDEAIATVEVRVWGETVSGQPVLMEEVINLEDEIDHVEYHYANTFELPIDEPGRYQYVVRALDVSGNRAVKGGNISIGFVDRLYLSDAENEDEVLNQGYDHMGGCRGIGTIMSMQRQGTNVFVADIYYPSQPTDNIRFVAFLDNDKPFLNSGGNQAQINYSLTGENVVAMTALTPGKLTSNLSEASFKLPVSQSGYYRVTVNMSTREVQATSISPTINASDQVKYPGWSADTPWPYIAVTGNTVDGGGGGWTETATSPQLTLEEGTRYRYSGTFRTNGGSANMSLNAPLSANDDVWGKGWFRLESARANMVDDYGDLITKVAPIGPSTGGANWGFSTAPAGTYKATYDLALNRFRIVRIGN